MTYLTTTDNPWSPFTNWDEWYNFDMMMGYNTCGKIARISRTNDALPEEANIEELNRAMDLLVESKACNKFGEVVNYIKVTDEKSEKTKVNS